MCPSPAIGIFYCTGHVNATHAASPGRSKTLYTWKIWLFLKTTCPRELCVGTHTHTHKLTLHHFETVVPPGGPPGASPLGGDLPRHVVPSRRSPSRLWERTWVPSYIATDGDRPSILVTTEGILFNILESIKSRKHQTTTPKPVTIFRGTEENGPFCPTTTLSSQPIPPRPPGPRRRSAARRGERAASPVPRRSAPGSAPALAPHYSFQMQIFWWI